MKIKMTPGAAILAALPFAAFAQDVPKEPEYASAAIDASLHQPMSQLPLTGTPNGIPLMTSHNSTDKPPYQMIEGKPVDTRPAEKKDDHDVFPGQSHAPYLHSLDYEVTTVADGLASPWSVAFLPDRKMLITEKPGNLLIVDSAGSKTPVSGVPKVFYLGQVGLLDVALDNNFASNHRMFFSYSEEVPGNKSNIAIASATLDEKAAALNDVKVIYRVAPSLDERMQMANEGGRIAMARDGTLFVIIGDRSKSPPWLVAQRLDTALGKMIHINPDGSAAAGGPFAGKPGALPEIYSIGHRSEQGLAFDKQGRLWEVEDGPRGGDELNLILPGRNYGWPVIVHGIDYPGETIGDGIVEKAGMEQPRYYWDPVIAPSGLTFYSGKLFPKWRNSVFVGGLRGTAVYRLEMNGDMVSAEEPLLANLRLRIRDVREGPDGALYVLSDGPGAKLMKLTPANK
jgi:glucose/arabinose dehydrogenase